MPMQPNREIINSWIGLTIDSEIGPLTLKRLEAIGAEQVVYAAADTKGEEKVVIKIPRNHIGFVLDLPPNATFKLYSTILSNETMVVLTGEDYEKEQKYNQSLSQRLYALRGSPLLTEILPLDLVWMRLAKVLMEAAEDGTQIALLSKYSTLLRCKFIRNVLIEWSSVDTTGSDPDTFLTILASERPILVDFPSQIAQDATTTLQILDALFDQVAASETVYKVENNPFLPYIAALTNGYDLPEKVFVDIVEMLREGGTKIYLQQLGQLLHLIESYDYFLLKQGISLEEPLLSTKDKSAVLNLLNQVMIKMPVKEMFEGIKLFKSEVLGSRT